MIPGNILSRSFLLFSTILFSLLLWLSISFLLLADRQRQDAGNLNNYIIVSSALRHASMAIAEERAASSWLTGIDGLFSAGYTLAGPRSQTDEALQTAISSLMQKISDPQLARQLRFQTTHLQGLLRDLQSRLAELNSKRRAFAADLSYPVSLRNRTLQDELFNFYSLLIDDLELLRYGTTYISAYTTRDTDIILQVADAAWNIALSNQLLTAIFEGYITTDRSIVSDASILATSAHNNIRQSLQIISRIDAYANKDEALHSHALKLEEWYLNHYQTQAHHTTQAIANGTDSPYTNHQWKKAAVTFAEYTQQMLDRAVAISQNNLVQVEQRAKKNLSIDIALVAACGLLMLSAYWIVRRMHYQATHDELTGLANRRLFNARCAQLLDQSGISRNSSLLKIDLHKFKTINDNFGQVTGDKILQRVGERLSVHIGTSGLAARLSGDEYAVLLHQRGSEQAAATAKELIHKLTGLYRIDGQPVEINLCIGFASHPDQARGSDELRRAADLALYEAKRTGPGATIVYRDEIAREFQERQQLELELTHALERSEFELHYQPQFNLENNVVEGVEALIRWRHPTRGLVSPFHFIPIAEDAGLLPAIGLWIINEAVRQVAHWRDDCGLHLRVSVNVSTHQFFHGDLVNTIATTLQREKVPPSAFEIEITESVAMAEMDIVVSKLNALRALGVRIALDDFGTGYSSLSYLQDLPLDTLKIDRTFITKIDSGATTQRLLLESIASMAKLLGFHTVAEGVETDQQLDMVRSLGIDTVQGYYYARPAKGERIPADIQAIDTAHGDHLRDVA